MLQLVAASNSLHWLCLSVCASLLACILLYQSFLMRWKLILCCFTEGGYRCSQHELHGSAWQESVQRLVVGDNKFFAPGNCRAAVQNAAYKALIDGYILNQFGLRYSGAMVADVHHILAKVRPMPVS